MSGRVEIGEDERDKKDRQYVDMFDREVMGKYKENPKNKDYKGPDTGSHWTWSTKSVKYESDLKKYDLNPAEAPESCVSRRWGKEIVGWNIVTHESWDHWEFDVGQMGPGRMEYGVFHREAPAIESGKIIFSHLPGGPREFNSWKEAKRYVRSIGLDLK